MIDVQLNTQLSNLNPFFINKDNEPHLNEINLNSPCITVEALSPTVFRVRKILGEQNQSSVSRYICGASITYEWVDVWGKLLCQNFASW